MKISMAIFLLLILPFTNYSQSIEISLNNGIVASQSNRISVFTNARNNNLVFSYSPSLAISYASNKYSFGLTSRIVNISSRLNTDGQPQFEYRNNGYDLSIRSADIGLFVLSSIVNNSFIRIQIGTEFNFLPVSINNYPRVLADNYSFVSNGTEYEVNFRLNTIQVRDLNFGIVSHLNFDFKLTNHFFIGLNFFARLGFQELSTNFVYYTIEPGFSANGIDEYDYKLVNFGNLFGTQIGMKYLIFK